MTRDVASRLHAATKTDVFVLPEASHNKDTMYVPGTDGAKMSKSKGNIIDIFQTDKKLRKQIMGIQTASTPIEEPMDTEGCNVLSLYNLLATPEQVDVLKENYKRPDFGYGHAKQALFEVISDTYSEQRESYSHYMANPQEIDSALKIGAQKAREVANKTLSRVKKVTGY